MCARSPAAEGDATGASIQRPGNATGPVFRHRSTPWRAITNVAGTPSPPTVAEIAEVMNMTPGRIEQMLQVLRQPLSLESPVGEEDETELGDLIEDEFSPDPEEFVSQAMTNDELRRSHRRYQVLSQRLVEIQEEERRAK